jgi:Mg-chelatase subunit ChlD
MKEKLWPGELTLAKHFAASLSSTSQAGLIAFNEVIQSKVPIASVPELASKLEQIEKTQPKGRTSIFTALGEAVDLLQRSRAGDTIYLLSDGGENWLPSAKWDILKDRFVTGFVCLH